MWSHERIRSPPRDAESGRGQSTARHSRVETPGHAVRSQEEDQVHQIAVCLTTSYSSATLMKPPPRGGSGVFRYLHHRSVEGHRIDRFIPILTMF